MTRILVFSDTHGRTAQMKAIMKEVDHHVVFHLGDHHSDLPEALSVKGNCDGPGAPTEACVEYDGVVFYLAHGHRDHVRSSREAIALKAKAAGASVCLYGHTHKKKEELIFGVKVLNPGSLSLPRDGSASYMILTVDQGLFEKEVIIL